VSGLSVVLADDHLLIRRGVRTLLESLEEVEVVAECDDYDSLMAAVAQHTPAVVVTDIRMPPTNTDEGIRAAREIRAAYPSTGVVVLSQFAEPSFVLQLFDDGSEGLGYLLKDRVDRAELDRAVQAVTTGGSAVDSKIVEVLVSARNRSDPAIDRLTAREREVLAAVAEGMNNAAVAAELIISDKAVAKHINSIFSKLDLGDADDTHRRVKAVLLWLSST